MGLVHTSKRKRSVRPTLLAAGSLLSAPCSVSADPVTISPVGCCWGVSVRGKLVCTRIDLPSAEHTAANLRTALQS